MWKVQFFLERQTLWNWKDEEEGEKFIFSPLKRRDNLEEGLRFLALFATRNLLELSTLCQVYNFWLNLTYNKSLTHFDSFWLILTQFDSTWLILIHFDSFCLIFIHLSHFYSFVSFRLILSQLVLLFFSSRDKIEKWETRGWFFEKSRLVFLENFSLYTMVKVQFLNFLLILNVQKICDLLVLSGDSIWCFKR